MSPPAAIPVLLVEDSPKLGEEICGHLRAAGFAPTWIRDGDEALGADFHRYQLLILDLTLPGAYGLDVLKRARERGAAVPVLILSVRNVAEEKARALDLGADDYLTKPFHPPELISRLRARLRRPALGADGGRIDLGALSVDLRARVALVGGEDARLTPIEFEILAALARRPGTAISREWLAERLLGGSAGDRGLDTHLWGLRRKLGPEGARIATVRGLGYRLEADEPR